MIRNLKNLNFTCTKDHDYTERWCKKSYSKPKFKPTALMMIDVDKPIGNDSLIEAI